MPRRWPVLLLVSALVAGAAGYLSSRSSPPTGRSSVALRLGVVVTPKAPGSLAVGPNGTLYVEDEDGQILEYLRKGTFRLVDFPEPADNVLFGSTTGTLYEESLSGGMAWAVSPYGEYNSITGSDRRLPFSAGNLVVGPGRTLYFTNGKDTVFSWNERGAPRPILSITNPIAASLGWPGPDSTCNIDGLAVNPSGDVFVYCDNWREVLERSASGAITDQGLMHPEGQALAAGPGDSVLGLEQESILSFGPHPSFGMTFARIPRIGPFWPSGAAVGPNGVVYVDQDGFPGSAALIAVTASRHVTVLWAKG